jgi:hypothetical protein
MPKCTNIKSIMITHYAAEVGATTDWLDLRGRSAWMTDVLEYGIHRSLSKLA